ncbi:ACN9-domain-containing protein [Byssothecium circinans]|uniref:Succinate dehydrogenase assembly factor 3 n=1 Tax=Byssothecium circinans TaxID=147558 RepID=A0A6A5TWC3_9PLEO|nr:ACN9-domain-containing protein [Byssothecium circinans]
MRYFNRLLAVATDAGASKPFRPAPMALLSPIPLYRRLLRCHRKLDFEQRVLGDKYLKSEWRAHKDIDNPVHIIGFLTEWQRYAQIVEGDSWKGEKMDKTKIDKMSDQQIGQLYELMQAIRKQELEEDKDDSLKPYSDK